MRLDGLSIQQYRVEVLLRNYICFARGLHFKEQGWKDRITCCQHYCIEGWVKVNREHPYICTRWLVTVWTMHAITSSVDQGQLGNLSWSSSTAQRHQRHQVSLIMIWLFVLCTSDYTEFYVTRSASVYSCRTQEQRQVIQLAKMFQNDYLICKVKS